MKTYLLNDDEVVIDDDYLKNFGDIKSLNDLTHVVYREVFTDSKGRKIVSGAYKTVKPDERNVFSGMQSKYDPYKKRMLDEIKADIAEAERELVKAKKALIKKRSEVKNMLQAKSNLLQAIESYNPGHYEMLNRILLQDFSYVLYPNDYEIVAKEDFFNTARDEELGAITLCLFDTTRNKNKLLMDRWSDGSGGYGGKVIMLFDTLDEAKKELKKKVLSDRMCDYTLRKIQGLNLPFTVKEKRAILARYKTGEDAKINHQKVMLNNTKNDCKRNIDFCKKVLKL